MQEGCGSLRDFRYMRFAGNSPVAELARVLIADGGSLRGSRYLTMLRGIAPVMGEFDRLPLSVVPPGRWLSAPCAWRRVVVFLLPERQHHGLDQAARAQPLRRIGRHLVSASRALISIHAHPLLLRRWHTGTPQDPGEANVPIGCLLRKCTTIRKRLLWHIHGTPTSTR